MKKMFFAIVVVALPIFASADLDKRPQNMTVIPQPQEAKDVVTPQNNETLPCPCIK